MPPPQQVCWSLSLRIHLIRYIIFFLVLMWPRSFAGGKRNRREKNYLLSWSWIVSGSGSKLFRSHCCLWKSGKGINLTTWFSIHVLLAWFSFPPMDLTYFQWRSPFIIFPSCHSSLLCLCHFSCISIFHLAILPLSCFIACGSFCSTLFISWETRLLKYWKWLWTYKLPLMKLNITQNTKILP